MTEQLKPEISARLLGKIIDEVFNFAIEDPSVIEDIYRAIAKDVNSRTDAQAGQQEPVGKVLSEQEMGTGYDRRSGPVIWFGGYPAPGLLYAAPQPSPDTSDIEGMVAMLENREWAEHAGTTPLGKRLEAAITDLMNEVAATAALVEALERVKLTESEARNHSVHNAAYWNNAVTACIDAVCRAQQDPAPRPSWLDGGAEAVAMAKEDEDRITQQEKKHAEK